MQRGGEVKKGVEESLRKLLRKPIGWILSSLKSEGVGGRRSSDVNELKIRGMPV